MIQNDLSKVHSLSEVIAKGPHNALSLDNLTMYVKFDDFLVPQMNLLFEKYRGVILESCIKVTLSEEVLAAYMYRPKYLSLKLYGYTDLWHLLLWINNMTTATQFNKSIIYVFDPDGIDMLEKIINLERQALLGNKNNPDVIVTDDVTLKR